LIRQVDVDDIYFKHELLVNKTIPNRVSISKSRMDFALVVGFADQKILVGQIEMRKVQQELFLNLSDSLNFRQTVINSITSLAYSRWGAGQGVLGDRPLVSILIDQGCLYKLVFTKPADIYEHPFKLYLRVEIYSNPSKMYEVLKDYTHQIVADYNDMLRAATLSTVHPSMWSPINFDLEEADSRYGNKWNLGFVFKAKGYRFLKFIENVDPDSSRDRWVSGMSQKDINPDSVYFVKCLHSMITFDWRDSYFKVALLCEISVSFTEFTKVSQPSCCSRSW
jgi:hypothetical protein